MVEMRVRKDTNCNSMAAAVAGCIESDVDWVRLSCIGAAAVNNAVKSVAIACNIININRGDDETECSLSITPMFGIKHIKNKETTVMYLDITKGEC